MGRKDKPSFSSVEDDKTISIGQKMRKKRQAQGIRLTEMAKQISYSKSYLSGVENGHIQPSLTLIKSYEKMLNAQLYEAEQATQKVPLNTSVALDMHIQNYPSSPQKDTIDMWKEQKPRKTEEEYADTLQKKQTWRDLLAEIIRDRPARERIIRELKINPITISRWIHEETIPRLDNLQRLLHAVPVHREILYNLLLHEFPDLALYIETDASFDFHKSVLKTYATVPTNMCFWSISTMVLHHLLEQLDPDLQHVSITLLQCHASSQHFIHSLRCVMSVGPLSWTNNNQNANSFFQGTESLAGQVLLLGSHYSIANVETYTGSLPFTAHSLSKVHRNLKNTPNTSYTIPRFHMYPVASEMAAPILRANTSAGVIHVTSTRPNAFSTPQLQLLLDCATLATLAFAPEDFYAYENIALHIMPPLPLQAPLLSRIPQRILQLMRKAIADNIPLSLTHAKHVIWEQVEEELLQMARATASNTTGSYSQKTS